MSGRLEGKIALITGGCSGIGLGTVELFASEGACVVAADVQDEKGAILAQRFGGRVRYAHCDVTSEADIAAACAMAKDAFGGLDILFNNAGVVSRKNISDVDLQTWHRTVGINLTGTLIGCQQAIAMMRENPGGSSGAIVNVSSTAGNTGIPSDVSYSATKAGVLGITRSVASWCAREKLNIRCNAIQPGTTLTSLTEESLRTIPNIMAAYESMSPMGRMAKPEEIAGLVLFLVSEDASYITGVGYLADGGMLAQHPGAWRAPD